MSQHHESTNAATATEFVPCPAPVASGDTVYDVNGNAHRVLAVTLRITTADSDTPTDVDLESRFGGWWFPTP